MDSSNVKVIFFLSSASPIETHVNEGILLCFSREFTLFSQSIFNCTTDSRGKSEVGSFQFAVLV